MAALHDVDALSNHMNCDDSFIWITGQIYRSNYDLQSYDDKAQFLDEWDDIDEKQVIYRNADKVSIYETFKRDPEQHDINNDDHRCMVKVYNVSNIDEIIYIKQTYLLMRKTNLLNFYGLYLDKKRNRMLMTMEPLQKTLKEYVESHKENRCKIQEIECKLIISYLLYDLYTLHKTGHIHCDINPSNIMLRDRKLNPTLNGWRLIDYENRLFIGDKQCIKAKEVRGCIEWTPPEQCYNNDNLNYFNYGTDLWSIGLIILYILFGHTPYQLTKRERQKHKTQKQYVEYFYNRKLLKDCGYDMDSDKNRGEIWLRNYLILLYVQDKISIDLFDLLHDYLLIFDPRKRINCKNVWNHKWFDEYRKLCESMRDKND